MNWQTEVINSINESILVVDSDLTLIYANKAAESIGISSEAVVGKSIFDIFPNLSRQKSTFLQVIQSGKTIINEQQTFITYRGELKTTLTSTFPIKEDGEITGAFEIFQDVSALQTVKEKLIELQKTNSEKRDKRGREYVLLENEFQAFIGEDESILKIKRDLHLYANTHSPLFIYGETGTGKEVIVQNIQDINDENAPLVTQNCAAIPDNLLESYLFGTVKGSFTGAEDKEGLFEIADGGTLFLDEINSLSMNLQAKLLRVLQDQKVRRVGGTKEVPVNVRIIAATNVHPKVLLEQKEIREDLFYRLNVLYVELPPLRKRRKDIPLLLDYFISQYNKQLGRHVKSVTPEALTYLMNYSWPGNIRELKNVIERFMNLSKSDTINENDIDFSGFLQVMSPEKADETQEVGKSIRINFKDKVENLERHLIADALEETNGNISQAARNLDLPQQTLSNKIKKYKLEKEISKIKLLKYE